MLAFAIVFSLIVKSSVLVAFIGASLAWLVVSVAAWYVRRKIPSPYRRLAFFLATFVVVFLPTVLRRAFD